MSFVCDIAGADFSFRQLRAVLKQRFGEHIFFTEYEKHPIQGFMVKLTVSGNYWKKDISYVGIADNYLEALSRLKKNIEDDVKD